MITNVKGVGVATETYKKKKDHKCHVNSMSLDHQTPSASSLAGTCLVLGIQGYSVDNLSVWVSISFMSCDSHHQPISHISHLLSCTLPPTHHHTPFISTSNYF